MLPQIPSRNWITEREIRSSEFYTRINNFVNQEVVIKRNVITAAI